MGGVHRHQKETASCTMVPGFLKSICLSKNGIPERSGFISSPGRFFYDEDDLLFSVQSRFRILPWIFLKYVSLTPAVVVDWAQLARPRGVPLAEASLLFPKKVRGLQ